jgi:hypothetical protein
MTRSFDHRAWGTGPPFSEAKSRSTSKLGTANIPPVNLNAPSGQIPTNPHHLDPSPDRALISPGAHDVQYFPHHLRLASSIFNDGNQRMVEAELQDKAQKKIEICKVA